MRSAYFSAAVIASFDLAGDTPLVSIRELNRETVVEPLVKSLHTMLPLPAFEDITMATFPHFLDRAIEVDAHEQLTELARAFPGAYAFFYSQGCNAEDSGDFAAADAQFARASALLSHLENRLPSEDRLLASLS